MKNIVVTFILILGTLLCSAAGVFITFSRNCESVCTEVLRLHIPANSNSPQDQSIKLELRDYLLDTFGSELGGCENLSVAEQKAAELLPEIERKSCEFLSQRGFDYGAKAELVSMYFTTREYDRLILPAGNYKALRITLGEGAGQNWWCVIFPQLCLPAVTEKPENNDNNTENADCCENSAERVLNSFGKPQKITVKFAVYEFFCKFFSGK